MRRDASAKAIFRLRDRQARAFRPYQREDDRNPANASQSARPIKSSLTRKWTNNELLMVSCCGIIKSRTTCYESESISNAKVSFQPSALDIIALAHHSCRILFWLRFHPVYVEGTHRISFTTTTASCCDTCRQQMILTSRILVSLLMSSMPSRNTQIAMNSVR